MNAMRIYEEVMSALHRQKAEAPKSPAPVLMSEGSPLPLFLSAPVLSGGTIPNGPKLTAVERCEDAPGRAHVPVQGSCDYPGRDRGSRKTPTEVNPGTQFRYFRRGRIVVPLVAAPASIHELPRRGVFSETASFRVRNSRPP